MKNANDAPANAGATLHDAEEIIRRQRKALGKPANYRPRALDLVRNNEMVIRQLRDAGYKQEDAVLFLLELGDEGHKPDTLRKAIASVLGPWSNSGRAVGSDDVRKSNDILPSEALVAEHDSVNVEAKYEDDAEEEGVL